MGLNSISVCTYLAIPIGVVKFNIRISSSRPFKHEFCLEHYNLAIDNPLLYHTGSLSDNNLDRQTRDFCIRHCLTLKQ